MVAIKKELVQRSDGLYEVVSEFISERKLTSRENLIHHLTKMIQDFSKDYENRSRFLYLVSPEGELAYKIVEYLENVDNFPQATKEKIDKLLGR